MPMKTLMIYAVMFLIFGVIYVVSRHIMKGKAGKAEEEFLRNYPDAVKVYTQRSGGFIISSTLSIYSVNEEVPVSFFDEEGNGFYCKVGKNIVEAEHSTTRPGVIYKSVTKSTGTTRMEIETAANKKYFFYFDKESKSFRIDLK